MINIQWLLSGYDYVWYNKSKSKKRRISIKHVKYCTCTPPFHPTCQQKGLDTYPGWASTTVWNARTTMAERVNFIVLEMTLGVAFVLARELLELQLCVHKIMCSNLQWRRSVEEIRIAFDFASLAVED